jgi:hypothetical protein
MTRLAHPFGALNRKAKRYVDQAFPHLKPSAICIGAQKGGTSALSQYLACHPGVAPSRVKEIDFFNCPARFARGVDFYHSHFPRRTPLNAGRLTFDITPGYLFGGEAAAERIRGYSPAMKLIVLLRDPLTRAYSAWNMYRKYCQENPEWFLGWVRRCDESQAANFYARRPSSFGKDFEKDILEELAEITNGRIVEMPILPLGEYFRLLKPYFDRFPREQILVFSSEEMQQDTEGHLRRFESFVGLRAHNWSQKQLAPRFVGGYAEAIPAKAIDAIESFYRAQNRDLFRFLGTELPWGSNVKAR